jgi:tetratricopeptide (TPR) repeat protein
VCAKKLKDTVKAAMARTKNKPAKSGPRSEEEKEDLLWQAQDLIYDAWELVDPRAKLALARKALTISPDCADAYALLADAAKGLDRRLELYREAVAAGERALGEKTFKEEVGNFWGILESRPYMRARAGLAQCLWDLGQHDEAIGHWWEMLRLNPDDNQGIRYVLAARLLELDRDLDLAALLKQYDSDGSAYTFWTKALLLFRTHGDNAKSRRALEWALESNPHVPVYLLGNKRLPRRLPEYVGWGDEREAMWWVSENMKAWKKTNGALAWLVETISAERPALLN